MTSSCLLLVGTVYSFKVIARTASNRLQRADTRVSISGSMLLCKCFRGSPPLPHP